MNSTTRIALHNATITYRSKLLFSNFNLTVEAGEHWAITGENSRGNHELLQAMAGRYFVASGTVSFPFFDEYKASGVNNDPLFSVHHLIGVVLMKHDFKNLSNLRDFFYQQRYNSAYSDNTVTVREYLSETENNLSRPGYWNYRRVVEAFDLSTLLDKHLIQLSNGETKRLRIGAAVLKNPVLLLLDNPLSGLDVEKRQAFEAVFAAIAQSGITLVMVVNPFEIPDVVTHVAMLDVNRQLRVVSRENYKPEPVNSTSEKQLNAKTLQLLLDKGDARQYKVVVKMKDVNVVYGEKNILKNINWEIHQGERWALSGPNGSGKSTLLSLINGDNPQAYANDIVLFDLQRGTGESIWDIKKLIGFMSPELFQFFPRNLTCAQVVESGFFDTFGVFGRSKKEYRHTTELWMEVMDLTDIKEQHMYEVNDSEQRLCLLARAMVKNPPLLILDEPCQGFDPHQQRHFKTIIDQMALHSNVTLIYVTHHQEELPDCITHRLHLK